MTLQKQYQFKGLNLRQSDILIPPEFASYASNCDLNYSGELRKRNGFELSATAGLPIIHMMVYQQANELLIMCSDGLYKKTGATFTKIPMSITGTVPTWTGDCTSIELNGTLYISDTTGTLPVFKYDGIVFTRAGNPKPIFKEDTGLIQAPFGEIDDYFGYKMAYAAPFGASVINGLIFALDRRPTGSIYTFLETPWGYERTPSIFDGLTDIAGIAASSNGNTVAVLKAVRGASGVDYLSTVSILVYTRTVSNLNYALTSTINHPGSITSQFHEFNFVMNGPANTIVFSDKDYLVRSTNIYTYYLSAPNTWVQLGVLSDSQQTGVSRGFGYSLDMITEPNVADVFLIVSSPLANTNQAIYGAGRAYIFTKTGAGQWTEQTFFSSPNQTLVSTVEAIVFGESVNIQRHVNPDNGTNTMKAFVSYKITGSAPQLAIYDYNTATNTWAAPVFITIPANENINWFGSVVRFINDATGTQKLLLISSPASASGKGLPTHGKVFVYTVTGDGAPYTLIDTLESPDNSADNNSNSSIIIRNFGFGSQILVTKVTSLKGILISYPAFNILDIDRVGRIFAFKESEKKPGTFLVNPGTSSENQKYARFYTTYVDANGNIINSEAVTFSFSGDVIKITLDTFRNTWYNDRYFIGNIVTTVSPVTNSTPTFSIGVVSHNLIAGDKVLVKTYTTTPSNLNTTYPHEFQLLTVVSVSPLFVELKTSELINDTYITNRLSYKGATVSVPLNGSNAYWNIFVSDDEFFGYQLVDSLSAQDIIVDDVTTITIIVSDVKISEDVDIFLNDIYDDTVLKKEIPYIRYLGTYQNLLLGANIKYPDEQAKAEFRNRFIWSDASIGGSAETFAPFDYEVIGENIAKELTAVIGTQDNIHVFKNRKCYAISGILIGGQYRVRELISEETGCVNHNSMIAARGQVMFMSEAGLYSVSGGANPNEITDSNQPLFMAPNVDLYRSVSTLDGKIEKVYTFLKHKTDPTKNLMIVWNYYFNQWYLYEGMGMSGPMVVYNDKLNIADGIYLKEMHDSVFTDVVLPGGTTKPVFFKYYTGWFHLGFPSLRKKFVNLVLFSILRLRDYAAIPFSVEPFASEPPNFSLDIKTQLDWIATDWDNFNVPFAANKRVDDHKLTQTQCQSLRYLIENNRDEPVLLTGYEFEWESTQDKPKGLT